MHNNTPLKIIGIFGGLAYLAQIMDQVAEDQEAALERAIGDESPARSWESSPGVPRRVFDPETCPGCGFYNCQCDDAAVGSPQSAMKTCPFCAEDIREAAILCKHCGRDLQPEPEPAPPAKTAKSAAKKGKTRRGD